METKKIISAIEKDNLEQLEKLFGEPTGTCISLKKPLDINARYENEERGFYLSYHWWDTFRYRAGAPGRFETPLGIACRLGHIRSVQKLLKLGAELNVLSFSILSFSIEKYPKCYRYRSNHTPLFIAAYYRHKEIVKTLLNKGAKFSEDEAKKLLLNHMNNLKSNNALEVICVLLDEFPELLHEEYNLEKNKDKIENKCSLLHIACRKDDKYSYDCVKELIKRGADIDCEDRFGRTPFFVAAMDCNKKIVKYFLKKFGEEAMFDQIDHKGHSVVYHLMHAKRTKKHVNMAEFLIEQGYKPKTGDLGILDYRRETKGKKRHGFFNDSSTETTVSDSEESSYSLSRSS